MYDHFYPLSVSACGIHYQEKVFETSIISAGPSKVKVTVKGAAAVDPESGESSQEV